MARIGWGGTSHIEQRSAPLKSFPVVSVVPAFMMSEMIACRNFGKETPVTPTPPMAASASTTRLGIIDLVRSFSILAVLAHHLGLMFIVQGAGNPALGWLWYKGWAKGWLGVDLFFVVSGYLITRRIAGSGGGIFHPDLRGFYVRRAGRILPLLLMLCLVGAGAAYCWGSWAPQGAKIFRLPGGGASLPLFGFAIAAFWMNWYQLFVNSDMGLHWGLLWSLAIEEQFYFFYPLSLRRLGGRRRTYLFLLFFILLAFLGRKATAGSFPRFGGYDYTSFAGFGYIAWGCLLYLASEEYKDFLARYRAFFSCLSVGGAGLVAAFYIRPQYKSDFFGITWGSTLVGAGLFLFLWGGLQWKWPNAHWARWVCFPGRLSYGMYLMHPLVLFLLWPCLARLSAFAALALFAASTTGLAYLSDRWFEKPMNRWVRKRWDRAR